ncbi:hypothetical protein FEM48_Zijuj05G0065400 [Ziziphus jujuba var. spinosa]|uniref:Wall-associated receptor kinase C-terminal domain-containing protein n=1 Tax=Ziziphus jujuba var. spinosa TaxID=714518 RepID=A0A978VDD2_ZIZJJ|nr:hypothetical protein FEM48_Zijuj05G0065400 [Ziziphus jujuba var. spinosa]
MLSEISSNVISRCILRQKCQEHETRTAFGELTKRVMFHLTSFKFGDYFPYLRWMDVVTGMASSLNSTFRELDLFLEKIIEDHKAALSGKDEQSSDHKDIVDILLQVQKDGVYDIELANDNIKAILMEDSLSVLLNSTKNREVLQLKIIVGVFQSYNSSEIKKALREGFEVKYEVDNEYCNGCTGSGGVCGYESMKPTCYCENQSFGNGTCITSVQPPAQAPAPAMNTLHHGPFEVKAGRCRNFDKFTGAPLLLGLNIWYSFSTWLKSGAHKIKQKAS